MTAPTATTPAIDAACAEHDAWHDAYKRHWKMCEASRFGGHCWTCDWLATEADNAGKRVMLAEERAR